MYPPRKDRWRWLIITLVSGILIQIPVAASVYFVGRDQILYTVLKYILCLSPLWLLRKGYQISHSDLVFMLVVSVIIQHWSYSLYQLAASALGERYVLTGLLDLLMQFAAFIAVYGLCYLLWGRKLEEIGPLNVGWIGTLLAVLPLNIVTLFIAFLKAELTLSMRMQFVLSLFEMLLGVFLLLIYLIFLNEMRRRQHEETALMLAERERQQFASLKRNVEAMRAQIHDLKYYIRSLKNNNSLSSEEMEGLNQIIRTYESTFRTGNQALDVILTDAADHCRSEDIQFMCMVDATGSAFIRETDLFVLLGNAFDNAIEYLCKVTDSAKRYLSVNVRPVSGGLLLFQIVNYYEGPDLEQESIHTTKANAEMHGFGLKNIRAVTEKYHGTLVMKTADLSFSLAILIPIQENGQTAVKT